MLRVSNFPGGCSPNRMRSHKQKAPREELTGLSPWPLQGARIWALAPRSTPQPNKCFAQRKSPGHDAGAQFYQESYARREPQTAPPR
jgi:hypothetical protein